MSFSVPPTNNDTRVIATSLNHYSNPSLSAINEAATWENNAVFAKEFLKGMSATRSRLKDNSPLIAPDSTVHQH